MGPPLQVGDQHDGGWKQERKGEEQKGTLSIRKWLKGSGTRLAASIHPTLLECQRVMCSLERACSTPLPFVLLPAACCLALLTCMLLPAYGTPFIILFTSYLCLSLSRSSCSSSSSPSSTSASACCCCRREYINVVRSGADRRQQLIAPTKRIPGTPPRSIR